MGCGDAVGLVVTDEARPFDPPTTIETTDFMKQELPLTRIKKIMKQDEEVEGTPKFVRSPYCVVSSLLMIESPPQHTRQYTLSLPQISLPPSPPPYA